MKKLLFLIIALILILSLAACSDNSDGGLGDITVSGSSNPSSSSGGGMSTFDPMQSTPDTSQPPNGNNPLIGQWSSLYDTPFEEANERIEFKSDGTFYFYYYQDPYEWDVIAGKYVLNTERGGTWEVKGNYEVKGDKIHCTKLLYSWKADFGSESNYTNKSVMDSDWAFYLSKEPPNGAEGLRNGHEWLCINIAMDWNQKTDTSKYYSFQKPTK